MEKQKKFIIVSFIFLVIAILSLGEIIYYISISPAFAVKKSVSVYIGKQKKYDDLFSQLQFKAHIKNIYIFKPLAYMRDIKTGKYEITSQTTYLQAIRMFGSGQQKPVKLILKNNIRQKKDLASQIGHQFKFGPSTLLKYLNSPNTVKSLGFDTVTILAMFIPNTYYIYWNTSIEEFLRRMKREYDRFWTAKRLAKAKSVSLTPIKVSILASIVEEETDSVFEYPIIAGLYLNRLRKGMLLQADPTVKFAVGDFSLKRIFLKHLKINSPYNTYKNLGLPPGPIRIPSIGAIDGVLNCLDSLNYSSQKKIYYMCASEDLSGRHNFASTFSEHSQNAKKYRAKLNKLNIKNTN